MLSNNFHSKYAVECKIGEGSFSEVVKCKHKQTGVEVAAKILKKTFKSQQHACDLPELIAMRKLRSHENILHMLESHFDPTIGKVTIIFELMDQSLYDMMKHSKKSVSETKSKYYLYQIIKGVAHIHQHGIFHRDIKPENILVKGDQLKISDLGSIKGCYASHPYTEYISTRWYRSPECLLTSGFYGPKMDVWAIGCVFYELLTLKPLFPGASEIDQIAKINGVLGTPSSRLVAKFRKHKSRNITVCFPAKKGTGISSLTPFIAETGRDILKQMLVYDPSLRINIRRLLEHKYFNDLREWEKLHRLKNYQPISDGPSMSESSKASTAADRLIRNPALFSVAVGQRRRKKPCDGSKQDSVTLKSTSVVASSEKRLKQSDRFVAAPPMPKRINNKILRTVNVTGSSSLSSSIPTLAKEDSIKITPSLIYNNLAKEKLRMRLENRKLYGQGDSTARINVKDCKGR